MTRPNFRFVAAGLTAGIAINVFDGTLYTVLLGRDGAAAMERLGLTAPGTAGMILYAALAFMVGFVAVWLYAGLRSRLGPGWPTAVKTGLAVWAVGYLGPFLDLAIEGIFTPRMFWIAATYTAVAVPVAVVLGALVYREAPATVAEGAPVGQPG